MRDARFLLALTVAAAPVVGHALGQYWYAFAVFFVAVPLLDMALGRDAAPATAAELERLRHGPFFRFVLHAWVPLQMGLIGWGAWLVGSGALGTGEAILFTASVGLATGGAGITIAHELGHKLPQLDRFLSRLLLASVSYGHFTVEHNRGHHARVATPEDPASARFGEGFWRFLPRTPGNWSARKCCGPGRRPSPSRRRWGSPSGPGQWRSSSARARSPSCNWKR